MSNQIVLITPNAVIPGFTTPPAPSFSEETKALFQEQKFTLPYCVTTLKGKVEDLEKMQIKLLKAKEHSVRDKIISVLALALVMSIIAGGVLGTYYSVLAAASFLTVFVPLVTWFTVLGLTAVYNHKWSDYEGQGVIPNLECAEPIVLPIVGPFIPILQTFGNVSRYQEAIEQKEAGVQQAAGEAKKFFSKHLERANDLLALLESGIVEMRGCLEKVRALPIIVVESEISLSSKLEAFEKAREELQAAITFFSGKF